MSPVHAAGDYDGMARVEGLYETGQRLVATDGRMVYPAQYLVVLGHKSVRS